MVHSKATEPIFITQHEKCICWVSAQCHCQYSLTDQSYLWPDINSQDHDGTTHHRHLSLLLPWFLHRLWAWHASAQVVIGKFLTQSIHACWLCISYQGRRAVHWSHSRINNNSSSTNSDKNDNFHFVTQSAVQRLNVGCETFSKATEQFQSDSVLDSLDTIHDTRQLTPSGSDVNAHHSPLLWSNYKANKMCG